MMVNNIPVNGWPQLKDLEAVQPILNRLDKIEAWKRTVKEETFTGDDITIENALALPARSLITEINAIQDLHGYDKPWAGGAGKNKLFTVADNIKAYNTAGTWNGDSYTLSGVTFTILKDGDGNVTGIKANGTTTTSSAISFDICRISTMTTGNYILSGCPSSGGGGTSAYYMKATSGSTNVYDEGSGVNLTVGSNNLIVTIFVGSASNKVFYPMIRLSTESDATFAPYSNICPISGRTAVVITRSDGDDISEDFTIQLGTTVYGADINWDTGVMTVTTAILVKNTADMDNSEDYPGWKESGIRALVGGGINRIITGINTNCGTAYGVNTTGVSGDTVLLPKDYYGGKTQTEWIALAMDIQIPVTLATPATIQLTPTMLEMLKGYNRVTLSDGYGTIELKALTGANWS